MSLINQMLQDLDSRRAVHGPNSGLPNAVRPLPAARRSYAPLLIGIGVLVLALGAALAWQLLDQRGMPEPRIETPRVAPPEAAVAPGLPPSSVVDAVPATAAKTSTEDEAAELRLTTSLPVLPESEPPPAPRALPVAPPKTAAPMPAPAALAAATNAAPVTPAPARASAPVLIEKSAASGSPHERAEGEYRKAVGVLNAGRLTEAVDGLRAALRHDALHSAARQLLFKLLVDNRRLDEAAELLHEGLQSQPAQISWAMSLGRLRVDRGDLPGALQTLQRSLPSAGNSADYQGFTAHVLQRLGRSAEAAEHYQSATRLAPAEGRWWLGLGLALEAVGQAVEARDALLRARASGTLNAELSALVDQKLR